VLDQGALPVRAIIARAVETQVNELRSGRRKMDLKKARRVLIRRQIERTP
jgi:dsRNA-specific ribonuclease